jgi:hypothetical protein
MTNTWGTNHIGLIYHQRFQCRHNYVVYKAEGYPIRPSSQATIDGFVRETKQLFDQQ